MEQALSGLRILDLSQGLAGPAGAKLLADFGAEVIKVEPPTGDCARELGPFPGDVPDSEQSALFLNYNRNKLGISLDVFTREGRALLDLLIAQSDAIICNYTPRQIEELHLDYESLAKVNPAIVVAAITPWGLTGPYRDYAVSDIVLDGFGHSMSSHGLKDREPLMLGGGLREHFVGRWAALATLAACVSAERSGTGQMLDISMMEPQLANVDRRVIYLIRYQYTGRTVPRAELGRNISNIRAGLQPCADGWIQVMLQPQDFEAFAKLIERPDWVHEERFLPLVEKFSRPDVQEELNAAFLGWAYVHTRREITEAARKVGLPIFPVNRLGDLLEDEHLAARDFWVDETHPVAGTQRYIGGAFKMQAGGYEQRRPAPLLGQHNHDIYCGRLGLTPEHLGRLASAGIVSSSKATIPPGYAAPPVDAAPARTQRPAPSPSRLPLEGVRVVDMTAVWAGPAATMLLGDLGAEVIRVESLQFAPTRTRGWLLRPRKEDLDKMGPSANTYADFDPGERPWNRFGTFNALNRNKLSMTVDLRRPEGLEIFKKLVAVSDVVLDNYGFGVMENLGLGEAQLREINPRLVVVSMPLFGSSGPNRATGGFGGVADAWSGFMAMRGYPDLDVSASQSVTHMDACTAPGSALAILSALRVRERTGEGQFIDFSQSENMLQSVGEYLLDYQWNDRNPEPLGNRDRWGGIQGCYPSTGDDMWVTLTVRTDAGWRRFAEATGRPEWLTDERFATRASRFAHHDEIDRGIAQWTSQRSAEESMHRLQAAGIAAAKVMNERDIFDDPHIRERGFFLKMTLPDAGTHLYPGHAWRALGTPLRSDRPAPTLGQHNEYVYREVLGYSEAEYARLVREEHIGTEYPPEMIGRG